MIHRINDVSFFDTLCYTIVSDENHKKGMLRKASRYLWAPNYG